MSFDKLKTNMINNKNILVTGGTGSFGSVFVEYLLENFKPRKVMVFSRDEQKHFQLQQKWKSNQSSIIRYFIGDVRDLERLKTATSQYGMTLLLPHVQKLYF